MFENSIFVETNVFRVTVVTYNLNKQPAANDANVQLNHLFTDDDRANDVIFVALVLNGWMDLINFIFFQSSRITYVGRCMATERVDGTIQRIFAS